MKLSKKTSLEFEALTTCLDQQLSDKEKHDKLLKLSLNIDWQALYQLTTIHKITPEVWETLKKSPDLHIPNDATKLFELAVNSNRQKAMNCTRALIKIISVLDNAKINSLPLKGTVLSLQSYANLASRHVGDIDLLLVDEAQVWKADQIIQDMGYRPLYLDFDLTPKQKQYYTRSFQDIVYYHDASNITLELHFNWTATPYLFPLSKQQAWENQESLNIANTTIACLNSVDHLLYLCAHGAKHQWFRLKWLIDIPNVYKQLSHAQINEFVEKAKALGLENMVLQAFSLSQNFLNMQIPAVLSEKLTTNAINQTSINKVATQAILSKNKTFVHAKLIKKYVVILKRIHYQLKLRTNYSYKIKVLKSYATHSNDWKLLAIPDRYFFLYYILRPLMILTRGFQRAKKI